ncbi:MAG: signal peptidase I [Elusimicrobiota bacterium]|nr:signal peptidase I [Elusimicrobiota bacterium]
MEERLLFVGVSLGLFAWYSRRWKERGGPVSPMQSALWHALFYAIAAFSIVMILTMVFEGRTKVIALWARALRVGDLVPALSAAAVAAVFGFWRAWSKGESVESRRHYLDDDLEWADTVFSSALLAWVLMTFLIQAFKIPSGSMEKTLLVGDHLFVNKFVYGMRVPFWGKRLLQLRKPQRGDVMVFEFPVTDPREPHCGKINAGENFIKRVIGLPGETITVSSGKVFVDGKLMSDETYAQWDEPFRQPESVHAKEISPERYQELWATHQLDRELGDIQKDFFGPVKVPAGGYFMMGDNRDHSCDSRYWGPVDSRFIKGKAWFIYWPPSRMKVVR